MARPESTWLGESLNTMHFANGTVVPAKDIERPKSEYKSEKGRFIPKLPPKKKVNMI